MTQTHFKLQDFMRLFTYERILSHLSVKTTSLRPLSEVLLSDFLPYDDKWMIDLMRGYLWEELF